MQGCHKCAYNDMKQFADYEKSPCSKCRAALDPEIEKNTPYEKIQNMEKYAMQPATLDGETRDVLLIALSRCLIPLIEMRDSAPETFSVVFSKIKYPQLSLSRIAHIAKCSRTNVSHHLNQAIKEFPELKTLLERR